MNTTEQLPNVSENQEMIAQMVRDFGVKEMEPQLWLSRICDDHY